MPVAMILEPGTTLAVRYLRSSEREVGYCDTTHRSAWSIMCRGSSPTGTISGASWSLIVCWSTKRHRSWRIMYGSSGHSFGCPSDAGLMGMSGLRLAHPCDPEGQRVWNETHASHRRGSADFSPPRVFDTLTVLTDRQPLHWRCSSVARDESWLALITIPGRRTSVVSVFA